MAFTAEGLKDAVLEKLNALSEGDLKSPIALHTAWADGLREYTTEELKATGVYAGTVPGPPVAPDPLNGEYDWVVTIFELTGEQLFEHVSGNTTDPFAKWKEAIEIGFKTITFAGLDETEKVTTTTGLVLSMFVLELDQSDIQNVLNRDDIIGVITQSIYDSVIGTDVSEVTSPATSTSPGTGTVTYDSVQ